MKYVLPALLALCAISAEAQCNTAPVAADDQVSAHAEPVLVDVLANDGDDGDALTVTVLANSCNAIATVDGFQLLELELTPQQPVRGDCTISYQVTDEGGETATATVNVKIIAEIFSDGLESGSTSAWSEVLQ